MKKLLLSIGFLSVILFSGCYQPVLYHVREDVEPTTATVSGPIRSITRYTADSTEYLVTIAQVNRPKKTNLFNTETGYTTILYKPASSSEHGEWKKYEDYPFSEKHHYDYFDKADHEGQQMLVCHADNNYLYIFSVSYTNDSVEGISYPSHLYGYAKQITANANGEFETSGDWKLILEAGPDSTDVPFYKQENLYFSNFSIFSTNAIAQADREVYIRFNDPSAKEEKYQTVKYYKFNGTGAPLDVTSTVTPIDKTDANLNRANSAVKFGGNTLFFNTGASTTNEAPGVPATYVYYGGNKKINYSSDGATFTQCAFDTSYEPSALCVCSDALLIGRANYNSTSTSANGGIIKTSLTAGVPGADIVPFTTNADVQLASTYFVLCLLNVDPSKSELNSTLYASIDFFGTGTSSAVSYDSIGLWSYYPNRGNWNRE